MISSVCSGLVASEGAGVGWRTAAMLFKTVDSASKCFYSLYRVIVSVRSQCLFTDDSSLFTLHTGKFQVFYYK